MGHLSHDRAWRCLAEVVVPCGAGLGVMDLKLTSYVFP